MASQNVIKHMKRILISHGFWNEKSCKTGEKILPLIAYGTPGTLMRRNIQNEWWDDMCLEEGFVFPVENSMIQTNTFDNGLGLDPSKSCFFLGSKEYNVNECHLRNELTADMIGSYLSALSSVNGRLPFSLVQMGKYFTGNMEENHDRLWKQSCEQSGMTLQLYTSPSGMFQVFDQWVVKRMRWWKKFLNNPESLVTKNVESDNNETTSTHIQYKFPWGTETIEAICNLGDRHLKEIEMSTGVNCKGKWMRKTLLPHVLQLQTSLEKSMMVFLVDGFKGREIFSTTSKTSKKQEEKYFLQLHTHLAPFKVALATTGQRTHEIKHVCEHFLKELRQNGIMVFETLDSNSQGDQFKRFDELGIPYTIVVNDQTLETGVIGLRNRDTTLKEQIHITNVCKTLMKYLKPI